MNRFIGLILVSSLFAPLGCAAEQSTEGESADYGLSSDSERSAAAGAPVPSDGVATANPKVSWLEFAAPPTGQAHGPLPEPWTAGPLPEPWNSSSSTSSTTSTSSTNNGSSTSSTTTSSTTSSGGNSGDSKKR